MINVVIYISQYYNEVKKFINVKSRSCHGNMTYLVNIFDIEGLITERGYMNITLLSSLAHLQGRKSCTLELSPNLSVRASDVIELPKIK